MRGWSSRVCLCGAPAGLASHMFCIITTTCQTVRIGSTKADSNTLQALCYAVQFNGMEWNLCNTTQYHTMQCNAIEWGSWIQTLAHGSVLVPCCKIAARCKHASKLTPAWQSRIQVSLHAPKFIKIALSVAFPVSCTFNVIHA